MFSRKSKAPLCSKAGKLQTGWGLRTSSLRTLNLRFDFSAIGNGFNINTVLSMCFIFLNSYCKNFKCLIKIYRTRKEYSHVYVALCRHVALIKMGTVDSVFHIIAQGKEIMFIIIGKQVLQKERYYFYLKIHSVSDLLVFKEHPANLLSIPLFPEGEISD